MKKRLIMIILSSIIALGMIGAPAVMAAESVIINESFDNTTKDNMDANWRLSDPNSFGDPNFSTTSGYLHLNWVQGRAIASLETFKNFTMTADVKMYGGQQYIGIRQVDFTPEGKTDMDYIFDRGDEERVNDPAYNSDTDATTKIGYSGIFIGVDDINNKLLVMVKTSDSSLKRGNRYVEASIDVPAATNLKEFQTFKIVDTGTEVQIFVANTLFAKVQLSNLVSGVYKTVKIINATTSAELNSITNANVSQSGSITFSERGATIDLKNVIISSDATSTPVNNANTSDLGAIQLAMLAITSSVIAFKSRKR